MIMLRRELCFYTAKQSSARSTVIHILSFYLVPFYFQVTQLPNWNSLMEFVDAMVFSKSKRSSYSKMNAKKEFGKRFVAFVNRSFKIKGERNGRILKKS